MPATRRTLTDSERAFAALERAARRTQRPRRDWLYLLAFFVLLGAAGAADTAQGAPRVTCHEDEPCWRWSAMGDDRRGIVRADTGATLVVSRCTFATMARRGMIDWSRTPRLHGDRYALKVCKTRATIPAMPKP